MTIKNSNNPLVSIALATYNGESFLRAQLDSLLSQTHKNIEIVIRDDASTDDTLLIIEEYAQNDSRISFVRNSENYGFKKNFELSISKCRGSIIFLCDQDDIWNEDKVEQHLGAYKNRQIQWVYNEVRLVDADGVNLGLLTDSDKNYYRKTSLLNRIGGRCILGCATSYRSDCLKNIFPISPFAPGHDSYIQLSIYPAKSIHLKEVLQDYRQHDNNVFAGFKKRPANDIKKDVEKSINYVQDLYLNSYFPLWKRLIFFMLFCGKFLKYYFKRNNY